MLDFARYEADGTVTAGPIQGMTWNSLTPSSRFWSEVVSWVNAGHTITPYSTTLSLDDYRIAVQNLIDETAKSKRYDSGTSFATYVTSTNPAWKAEAEVFVAWRDRVWAYVYQQFENYSQGGTPPTINQLVQAIGTNIPIIWPV